ncbi:heavy metal-associated isoprenylated plant protein 7-like [Diospyros lotus]|uniref:heavy metal-associated isoprenylated plant protein 7-like n=1 Tax=Diospyros lotus TaxID=55363 RepID=UPI0022519E92|nr:heavy metal-associated isoprenylated plant protein 7-like [Diospyros lotus]
MGEEEKKPEEPTKAPEAEKKEAPPAEESKKAPPAPPPPPEPIVLRVYMHCEGCARKVRKCLKGFQGVEDVETDCKNHKVVVKGEKADPLKVLERVQRKSHRQVELLSPIPPPPPPEDAKKPEEKEAPKPEEKKEPPVIVTVVLKVYMHCEACAQEIKKRILRMKGVENVAPDLKGSQVTVKGVFEPASLVDYVYKRTGKQAVIVKQEPEPEKEEEKGKEGKEEKKPDDAGDGEKAAAKKGEDGAKEKKAGDGEQAAAPAAEGGEDAANVVELKKNEFFQNYPQNFQVYPSQPRYELHAYPSPLPYPPQIFSDENPNACSVM